MFSRSAPARAIRPPFSLGWRAKWSASNVTERWPTAARERLETLGYTNVTILAGDGFAGVPERRLIDRIIVTAAAEEVPEALVEQLADGGKMVLPLGPLDGTQHIVKLTKTAGGLSRQSLIAVRFVPLLPGQAREL